MQQGLTKRFVHPEVVTSHFHIRNGDTVADFGAGVGYFLPALSKRAGDGRVYACEVQQNLISTIERQKRVERLGNVAPLRCDIEHSIPLHEGQLDVGVMVNTLFQLEDRGAALKEIARVMRKGGKMFIIDWSESFGNLGPTPDLVVSVDAVKEYAAAAEFSFERDFPAGEHHYGLAFRKK